MNKTMASEVDGAYVVEIDRQHDPLGYFHELFSSIRYDANLPHVLQVNACCSAKGVIRGMHAAHFNKVCTCLCGRLFDVLADVRKGSETYGHWFGVWLTEINCKQVFVPAGCAHGFYADEDGTMLLYAQDGLSSPNNPERNIHYKDPFLNIAWPLAEGYLLSTKDSNADYLDGSADEVLRD